MDSATINDLILTKLDNLESGQSQMGKELSTVVERMDQRDKRYIDEFSNIKKDIEKGYEGRKVLHQKQDVLDKKIEKIQPEITFVKAVRQNVNKIIGWAVIIIITAVILTALPKIIEVLK